MNYKGILGIILLIVTPLGIFKTPNTAHHLTTDLLAGLWLAFIMGLIWYGWDPH